MNNTSNRSACYTSGYKMWVKMWEKKEQNTPQQQDTEFDQLSDHYQMNKFCVWNDLFSRTELTLIDPKLNSDWSPIFSDFFRFFWRPNVVQSWLQQGVAGKWARTWLHNRVRACCIVNGWQLSLKCHMVLVGQNRKECIGKRRLYSTREKPSDKYRHQVPHTPLPVNLLD